jgi:RNA polymerase sigma-70 factor (ECF subfamily)
MVTYSCHTDDQLLSLMKDGDERAFAELYTRYWDKLFAVAYHRLGSQMEAEGVVQDIYVSLWRRREKLELSYSLKTYLSVAVKYQVIMHLARSRRQRKYEQWLNRTAVKGRDTTSEWLSERELKARIEKCCQALPEKCRIVFDMSRQGYKNVYIARKLHISEKTVEGHITRALRILRASLKLLLPLLLLMIKKNI